MYWPQICFLQGKFSIWLYGYSEVAMQDRDLCASLKYMSHYRGHSYRQSHQASLRYMKDHAELVETLLMF